MTYRPAPAPTVPAPTSGEGRGAAGREACTCQAGGVDLASVEEGRRSEKKEKKDKRQNRGREATHDSQPDGPLLTSTLLSSDPALLRRPRFPAQNMQYQRLDATQACAATHGPAEPGAGR